MRDIQSALVVIRRALDNEIAGQRFYHDASFYCVDPWAKDVFARLAREEERHTHLLLLEYQAVETSGEWVDPDKALASGVEVDITRLTFPEDEPTGELFPHQWSLDGTVDRRSNDLEALAFGIDMERKAISLYGEEANTSQEPAAQRAYRFLLEEETRHYDELKGEWERLAGMPFVKA
jgi:rubrerythrin